MKSAPIFAVGVLWPVFLTASSAGPERVAREDPPNPLATRIQALLGIRADSADILTPLAGGIAALPGNDRVALARATDQLVDALLTGAAPTALSGLIISRVHTGDHFSYQNKEWPYGTYVARYAVAMHLWNVAQLSRRDDPARAARYAKAALLLAGHEDFAWGKGTVRAVLKDVDLFAEVTQLSNEQRDGVRAFKADMQEKWSHLQQIVTPTLKATDAFIKDPDGGMPPEQVTKVIDGLRVWKQRSTSIGDLHEQCSAIDEAWTLRNIAAARRNERALAAVDQFLSEWKNEKPGVPVDRWLTEAMNRRGEPPKGPRVQELKPGDPLIRQLTGN